MARAVSRRRLPAEVWVRTQASSCDIYGVQSGTGTGPSPSTFIVPCQCHSTNSPYPSSSTRLSYHKERCAKPAKLPQDRWVVEMYHCGAFA